MYKKNDKFGEESTKEDDSYASRSIHAIGSCLLLLLLLLLIFL